MNVCLVQKNAERPYKVIDAKRKNYSSYLLPKELWGEGEDTLYKLVAKWSLLKNDFICCDDVAENFGLSKRQASNIISNLHRKHTDIIKCTLKRVKIGKGNVIKTYIKVTEINNFTDYKSQSSPIVKNKSKVKELNINNDRWKFLSQKWS